MTFVSVFIPMPETIDDYFVARDLHGNSVAAALARWFMKGAPPEARLELLCSSEPRRMRLCREVSGQEKVTITCVAPRPEFGTLAHLRVLSQDLVVIPPAAVILPFEIIERILEHHTQQKNDITILSDGPVNARLTVIRQALLEWAAKESLPRQFATIGQFVSVLLRLQEGTPPGMPDIRIGHLSIAASCGRPALHLPNEAPMEEESDRQLLLTCSSRLLSASRESQISILESYGLELAEKRGSLYSAIRKQKRSRTGKGPVVLYVSTRSGYSGAEEALCRLMSGMHPYVRTYACTSVEGYFSRELRRAGAVTTVAGFDLSRPTLRVANWMSETIDEVHPDIIHFNGHCGSSVLTAAAARGVKCILHARTAEGVAYGEYGYYCSRVIAVSRFAEEALRRGGYDSRKIAVIYDPVCAASCGQAGTTTDEVKRELGIEQKARIILCAARYDRKKRQDVVIDAVASLASRYPGLVLVCAGDETHDCDWFGEVQARAETKLGKSGSRILPFKRDIGSLMAAAEAVVLCSEQEALGMAALEAMAIGTPVVAGTVGGLSEIVQDGVNGFTAEPGDTQSLAAALDRLLVDSDLTKRIASRSKQFVECELSVERICAQVNDVYRHILEE